MLRSLQPPQKTSPQHRQWCRRLVIENCEAHLWQVDRALSGTQTGRDMPRLSISDLRTSGRIVIDSVYKKGPA